MYGIEVWASAYNNQYLLQIGEFCKRAVRYGFTTHYMPKTERIRARDKQLWGKITRDLKYPLHSLLPPLKTRILRQRGRSFILPIKKTERFKRCFINNVFSTLSSIFFSIVLYLYFVTYIVNSLVCLWVLFSVFNIYK